MCAQLGPVWFAFASSSTASLFALCSSFTLFINIVYIACLLRLLIFVVFLRAGFVPDVGVLSVFPFRISTDFHFIMWSSKSLFGVVLITSIVPRLRRLCSNSPRSRSVDLVLSTLICEKETGEKLGRLCYSRDEKQPCGASINRHFDLWSGAPQEV